MARSQRARNWLFQCKHIAAETPSVGAVCCFPLCVTVQLPRAFFLCTLQLRLRAPCARRSRGYVQAQIRRSCSESSLGTRQNVDGGTTGDRFFESGSISSLLFRRLQTFRT